MREIRCGKCNRLLAKKYDDTATPLAIMTAVKKDKEQPRIEFKCNRCKAVSSIQT